MNKTILTVLLMTVALGLSATATEVSVPYNDWQCGNVWVCPFSADSMFPPNPCHWEYRCGDVEEETRVDVPETDLTEVESRIETLETTKHRSMSNTDLWRILTGKGSTMYSVMSFYDWLKDKFVSAQDFETYKLEQEEMDRKQNARIFACEDALGMTEGYQ